METVKLLQSKIKEFNDIYDTDFEIGVIDDRGKEQDWLYCLKVGDSYLSNEGKWNGQEMYAYICGMIFGAL